MSESDKSQVKIRFTTQEEDELLHVSETPLFVPISLKRYGLSEIVNHLLENDKEDKTPVPFDFLIDGVLLRTSIEEYLVKNGLSHEAFLTLEYTRAVLPPSFLASFNNDDWISSLATVNPLSKAANAFSLSMSQPKILSGSYDGIVRTYNMSGEIEALYSGHTGPVRAVEWISANRIVSAANDREVRLWRTSYGKDDGEEAGKTVAILEGHKGPVVSLAVDHQTERIVSGGYDNCVAVWSFHHQEMTATEAFQHDGAGAISSSTRKRRKKAVQDLNVRRRSPLAVLEGHKQPVEGVVFDSHDPSVAYSVGQDHTVKTWDLVTGRNVDTRSTGYSLLSVVQLPDVNLLATGSSARHINLHDPRVSSTTTDQMSKKLVGHTNFVVSLAACPNNSNMFASASHDGTVKVWDVRSEKSLYTITRDEKNTKVFGVAWDNSIAIVSGGSDKKVQINKGTDIAK